MSPLSNYCENINLTPTNTCVLSSKLDILQFKMLPSANTKKTPHKPVAILYPLLFLQVLFIHLIVLPHFFLQQLCHFSILDELKLRSMLLNIFWPVDQNTSSLSLEKVPSGGKWSIHQKALSREDVESSSSENFKIQ